MKFAVAVACLLLAAPAFAANDPFFPKTVVTATHCKVGGRLTATVKEGRCQGYLAVDCKAHAISVSTIATKVKRAFTDKLCNLAYIEESADAIALAVASVFTRALVTLKCTDKGGACGYAASKGDALSTAFADAFVAVIAEANVGKDKAFCHADIRALVAIFAEAQSFSYSKACVSGDEFAKSLHANLAKFIAKGIVDVLARSTARVCEKTPHKIVPAKHKVISFEASKKTSKCTAFIDGGVDVKEIPFNKELKDEGPGFNLGSSSGGRNPFCREVSSTAVFCCRYPNTCRFNRLKLIGREVFGKFKKNDLKCRCH